MLFIFKQSLTILPVPPEIVKRAQQKKGTEQMTIDYSENRSYFSGSNTLGAAVLMIIFGGVLVYYGGFKYGMTWSWWVGLILFALGVLNMRAYIKRAKDKDIDACAQTLFEKIDDMAFKKLGIDASEVSMVQPVKFWGYVFKNPSVLGGKAENDANWIKGEDKRWRAAEIELTGFYFGEHSVYCYIQTASLVSDAKKEITEEYYYKDIVSIKTDTKDVPIVDKAGEETGERFTQQIFILNNTGGDVRGCCVADVEVAEAAVGAFRALLKQKKI